MAAQTPGARDGSGLDIEGILRTIPHRFPFLMVDRVLGWEPESWIECVKAVTADEPFFQGHFPGQPIMPGVLQIEAAAQASALLVYLTEPDRSDLLVFGQVKRFTFKRGVHPGEVLHVRVDSKVMNGPNGMGAARLTVDDEEVAKGTLVFGSVAREL